MMLADERARAVRETIETVRGIEAQFGVTRDTLDRIKPVLIKLAAKIKKGEHHQYARNDRSDQEREEQGEETARPSPLVGSRRVRAGAHGTRARSGGPLRGVRRAHAQAP